MQLISANDLPNGYTPKVTNSQGNDGQNVYKCNGIIEKGRTWRICRFAG